MKDGSSVLLVSNCKISLANSPKDT